jgi:hypothetical protein
MRRNLCLTPMSIRQIGSSNARFRLIHVVTVAAPSTDEAIRTKEPPRTAVRHAVDDLGLSSDAAHIEVGGPLDVRPSLFLWILLSIAMRLIPIGEMTGARITEGRHGGASP